MSLPGFRGRSRSSRLAIVAVFAVFGIAVAGVTHSLTHSLALIRVERGDGAHRNASQRLDCDGAGRAENKVLDRLGACGDLDARRTEQHGADLPSLAGLPTYFVENRGQFDEAARFVASDRRIKTALTDRGVSFAAAEPQPDGTAIWRISAIDFVDPQRPLKPRGVGKLPGTHSYFIGQDPSKWATGVSTFAAVQYDDVAPGVDLILVEREGAMAYDLYVAPGANLSAVELKCHRCGELSIDEDGSLVVPTELGTLRQKTPKAWYVNSDGSPAPVVCAFELRGGARFGFRVDCGGSLRPLIVDPTLQWSTYFGGDSDDFVQAVDVDSGLVTIGGRTSGANTGSDPFPIFPAAAPPNYQVALAGGIDGFVARLDPSQTGAAQLVFSTYLGGSAVSSYSDDEVTDLEVDSAGGVAIVGNSESPTFPVTSNALQAAIPCAATPNGFVAHLAIGAGPTVQLDYSTYFGATGGRSRIRGLDLNAGTIVTFGGDAWGGLMTSTNADDGTWENAASEDAFVARVDWTKPASTALIYSSYLSRYSPSLGGKAAIDYVTAVAWSGNRIWAGGTSGNAFFPVGTNVPLIPAFDMANNGSGAPFDGFILKLDPTLSPGTQVEYSTFIGGTGAEELLDMEVWNGSVYACGHTASADFQTTPALDPNYEAPGHKRDLSGTTDAWVIKLRPIFNATNSAHDLRYGSYLGGWEGEKAFTIRRIASKAVVVVGETSSDSSISPPFPTGSTELGATFDSTLDGERDAFVTYLSWAGMVPPPGNQNPIAQQIKYSTFHGGSGSDYAWAVAVDGFDVFVIGNSDDSGLPLAGNPFDSTQAGNEGWVAHWLLPSSSQ